MKSKRLILWPLYWLFLLQPLPLHGQATVSVVEQDLQLVEETDDVVITRLGCFEEEGVRRGMTLAFGDELRSASGKTTVQLSCPAGSSLTLSESFRAVIVPSDDKEDCGVTLLSGGADFVTDQPTSLSSGDGEVTLGSKRTQYGMRVWREGSDPVREVLVYDGVVRAEQRSTGASNLLVAGTKLIARATGWDERKVIVTDTARTAALYASVDTSQASDSDESKQDIFERLRGRYQKVLENPEEPIHRLDLAVAQLNLRIGSQVTLYQLDRAEQSRIDDRRQRAMIAAAKGITYQQLGKTDQAKTQYRRAERIDSSVLEEASLSQYRLDPGVIQGMHVLRQPGLAPTPQVHGSAGAIQLKVEAKPDTIAQGGSTRLVVQALDAGGKSITGANVEITAGGGVFEGSRASKITGLTDRRGVFSAVWRCRPCAPGYVFGVKVSKQGYQAASAEARVAIR